MTRMSMGCRHVRQQPQLQQTRPAFGFGCSMRGQALTCCPRAPVTVARAGILQVFAKQNSLRRQRTAERARLYNKSKKSAVKTRMKKVFKALTALAKENPTSEDAFKPVEQMINEAFEEIDKATGLVPEHSDIVLQARA
eukprot:jgi/Astpho2/465/Aster-03510